METLFSTGAQISFTIVGLFFVALTVDSESRKFWLGDKALNKPADTIQWHAPGQVADRKHYCQ